MKNLSLLALSALSLGIGACATRPDSIHADFVSHERFVQLDCRTLASRKTDAVLNLQSLSQKQDDKANGDALGVFLIGVPISKLSGDYEAAIARSKGEIEAIETAEIKTACPVSPRPVLAAKPRYGCTDRDRYSTLPPNGRDCL